MVYRYRHKPPKYAHLEDVTMGDAEVLDVLVPAVDGEVAVSAAAVLAPGLPLLGDVVVLQLEPVVVPGVVRQQRPLAGRVEVLPTQETSQQLLQRQPGLTVALGIILQEVQRSCDRLILNLGILNFSSIYQLRFVADILRHLDVDTDFLDAISVLSL